jgi:hypothetical protein
MIPNELITEIPDGTNKKLINDVNDVPRVSTCSNFTIFNDNRVNNNIKPTTEAGIGNGNLEEIKFETNIITEKINA